MLLGNIVFTLFVPSIYVELQYYSGTGLVQFRTAAVLLSTSIVPFCTGIQQSFCTSIYVPELYTQQVLSPCVLSNLSKRSINLRWK